MIRLLHAADLHLDSPLGSLPPDKARLRRQEMRALPEKLRSLAESEGAQLVLLSGDVTDVPEPARETVDALSAALERMEVPVFIAPGNHDFVRSGGFWERLGQIGNVHVFTEPRLSCVEVEELGLRVWGAGYRDSVCPPLLRDFSVEGAGDWLDVLVLHAVLTRGASPYCPVTEEELAGSGLDYAALGHTHSYSGERSAGGCTFAWPGCAAGTGFDECGEKGVILADIGERRRQLRFVPLGERRFHSLSVDAAGDALAAALAALPEGAERDVCRLILTGEREGRVDLDALRAALNGRCFHLELRDDTTARTELWAGCGELSLRGLFLENMKERLAKAGTEEERGTLQLALRYGLAALEGGEEP